MFFYLLLKETFNPETEIRTFRVNLALLGSCCRHVRSPTAGRMSLGENKPYVNAGRHGQAVRKTFHANRHILCDQIVSVYHCLLVFQVVVTLWLRGCGNQRVESRQINGVRWGHDQINTNEPGNNTVSQKGFETIFCNRNWDDMVSYVNDTVR